MVRGGETVANDQEGAPVDERADESARRQRRAALRALPTPADVELTVQDAPPLLDVIDELSEPRIAELHALLRDVDGLRTSLRRDLTLAATAVEAGADDFDNWLLLGDDGQVRTFEERALEHLQQLEAQEVADELPPSTAVPAPRRRRRMLPAAPMVAACAALFGFVTGSVPGLPTSHPAAPHTSNVALNSYARVTTLATSGASATSISQAAQQFHAELAPLVAQAGTNPAAAERAIALLNSERIVISAGPDSPALRAVLHQADLLVARLRAGLPHTPRVSVVVPQAPKKSTTTKSSPVPKPSPTPTTAPKPSPSPSPAATPKPTPSPSASNPLPGSPFQQ